MLCDFALASPQVFENKTVLELGAGVGMSSIVLAQIAKQVIATGILTFSLCGGSIFGFNNFLHIFLQVEI